ncbi:MAG: nucleoside triphosphate pyrophosphohydrolase [Fusobacteriaceae bacterium]
MSEFNKVVELMKILRGENGCPWDKKQTLQSLKEYLMEEAYETLEVMDEGGDKLKGELGDLLLNIIFQAQICEEKGEFDIYDVIKNLSEKLIRRHPHVFDEEGKKSGEYRWDEIKNSEKEHEDRKSVLDGIPKTFPPMMRAEKLILKASKAGFDWDNLDQVLDKVQEEISELRVELKVQAREKIQDELGDVFFSLINLTRHLGYNSSEILEKANQKFERRFRSVEKNCVLSESTHDEMEEKWQEFKRLEKKEKN